MLTLDHNVAYVQIRSLLRSTLKPPSAPQNEKTPSFIITSYCRGHEALPYYSVLLQKCSTISSLKITWETDLRTTFIENEWTIILHNT